MSSDSPNKTKQTENLEEEILYEPPSIIFESVISTRAGSPIIGGDDLAPPVEDDSVDLFPSN